MRNKVKILVSASGFALAAISAGPAFAAGTASGTTITNTATINFSVGGVAQTAINASNSFVVDRQINLTVAEVGTTTTSVSPGQTAAVTTFTVTNTGNETQDFRLTASQLSGGTAPHGGTDAFDVTGVTLYRDTNSNGSYDAGTDTAITYLDEVAADASRTVFVVADVPLTATNGQIAAVALTAEAREGGTASTEGNAITATSGADTAGTKDTVFIDGAGSDDAARDARFSARDDYTVAAPVLTVSKISWVISDPVNSTTNPKRIPGAIIGYCIIINNAAGGTAASNVSISDTLPAATTYEAGTVLLGGSESSGTCSGGTTSTASFSAGVVSSGTISSIAANSNTVLWFQAKVN